VHTRVLLFTRQAELVLAAKGGDGSWERDRSLAESDSSLLLGSLADLENTFGGAESEARRGWSFG